MVSSRQESDIEEKMRQIKDTIDDDGKTEADVERETRKLIAYMQEEGLLHLE